MSQNVTLKCRGLYTFPNVLGETPDGALLEADNVVIDNDGIINPRRGNALYGQSFGSSSVRAKQLLTYRGRILRHYSSTVEYDSDGAGTFTSLSTSISEPESGRRLKYVESNGNLYFTSSQGIKKISALTVNDVVSAGITNSGGVKALSGSAVLNSQEGFFVQDGAVAYRIVWGKRDANDNVIPGTPSQRIVISNSMLDLLVADFNKLLQDLDTASAADGADSLSDTNYYSSLGIVINPSATALYNGLKSLANGVTNKLDVDLGGTTFQTISLPSAPSEPATTGQLTNMQVYYDAIVDALNLHAGISATAKSALTAGVFSNSIQSSTVDLTFVVPNAVTTSHFYQIYRSAVAFSSGVSTLSDITPDDELQLILEDNPTSGEISAKSVTFHDTVPESFRQGGAYLYTNANSGEGILQANEPPPLSKDIALFKGTTFFANTVSKSSLNISLLTQIGLIGKTFTITQGMTSNVYTFYAAGTSPGVGKVNVSASATPAQQVDETARNLVAAINANSSEVVDAYYMSGPTDVPGLIYLEVRNFADGDFILTSNIGTAFSPDITSPGVTSASEVRQNRIFYSKYQQPEAVPTVNYIDVGPRNKAILRILPLRDSLFVLTQGGVYRLSGDTGSFQVSLFDSSVQLKAPDAAVVLNNQIYMFSDQGIVTISDTGVSVISRPIEDKLLPLILYSNYAIATFAVSYESDRSFLVWTVTEPTDTVATQCFKFNTFTNSWVRWPISKSCGVVVPETSILYLGAGDVNFTEKERKSYSRLDYADREDVIPLAIGGLSSNVLYLGGLHDTSVGDVYTQTQYLTISKYNRLLGKLDLDSGVADSDYYNTLKASASVNLRDFVTSLAVKLDADSGVNYSDYASTISGFGTTFSDTQSAFNAIVTKLNIDSGVTFFDYTTSTGTVSFEAVVTSIDTTTNKITLSYPAPFIAGNVSLFHSIPSKVTWIPHHFGDPSLTKHVREGTFLFDSAAFTSAIVSYASDLNIGFTDIPVVGEGNGSFGSTIWGKTNWGGEGSSRPIRTYIPLRNQRCRYISPRMQHSTALEKYAVLGVSLTYENVSSRGYR